MTQQEKQETLQRCHEKMSEFSPECFLEAKAQASSLLISRAMQVWNVTWQRCQEVSRRLEECLQGLEQTHHPLAPHGWHNDGVEASNAELSFDTNPVPPSAELCRNPPAHSELSLCRERDSIYGTVTCFNINFCQSRRGRKGTRTATAADQDPAKNSPKKTSQDRRQKTIEGSGTVGCQWFPWQHNSRRYLSEDCPTSSPKSQTLPSTRFETQTPAPGCKSQIPDSICPGIRTAAPTCPQSQPSSRDVQAAHPESFCSEESYTHGQTFHSEGTIVWKKDVDRTGPSTPSKSM